MAGTSTGWSRSAKSSIAAGRSTCRELLLAQPGRLRTGARPRDTSAGAARATFATFS
jgi:hypothetical protein